MDFDSGFSIRLMHGKKGSKCLEFLLLEFLVGFVGEIDES
jgi:hypothetical protein